MKQLKLAVMAFLIINVLLLIVGAFLDRNYRIEKEIIIKKESKAVFEYVRQLKNQSNYSIWALKDPKMQKDFKGEDGTVGCIYTWKSSVQEVGEGEQEITGIKENERIDYELRFKKPMESKDHAYMEVEHISENETRVKWGFYGQMDYPFNLILLVLNFEKTVGASLFEGLQNLKVILEKK